MLFNMGDYVSRNSYNNDTIFEIIGMDGNPLSAETLSNPNARIAFIASGNKTLLNAIYEIIKTK